jgi:serine/threonine protein kinase
MGRVAIKIILKKNVKGNERMVLDELQMLQSMKHPHIVKFVDWFESRASPNPHRQNDTNELASVADQSRPFCRTNTIS